MRRPSPGFARALALAAIRETFEETGLALGVYSEGAPDDPPPGAWTRFAATGVVPALDGIDFLARAITPPGRPRRFDARFLIADARFVAKRVEGAVHPKPNLSNSSGRRSIRRVSSISPRSPARRSKISLEAFAGGLDKRRPRPSTASCGANACARSFRGTISDDDEPTLSTHFGCS